MSNEEYVPESSSDDTNSEDESDTDSIIQPTKKQKLDKNSILFILNENILDKINPEINIDKSNNEDKYKKYKKDLDLIDKINKKELDIIEKILESKFDINIKAKLIEKVDESTPYDTKNLTWVNQVLKLPIGIYKTVYDSKSNNINNFLLKSRNLLDKHIYGMENVKEELLDFIVKCIYDSNNNGSVLALKGPRGVGKTKVCRALSTIFNLPLHQLSFGGMSDSMVLLGHDSTYVGSKCGRIASFLQESGCMNPIIFCDEIDKISDHNSAAVEGVLTHLLDETQNKEFNDLYFDGIPLDLSKILFVVSFNREENIDPILLNRMKVIEVKGLPIEDKVNIVKLFILPEINYNKFELTDEIIKYIINEKTKKEDGMRNIKKNIETVINRLNTMVIVNTCNNSNSITSKFSYQNIKLKLNKDDNYIIDKKVINIILSANEVNEPWRNMYV